MPYVDVTQTPLPCLPARAPDSHKGTFGRCLLLGGSRGMCGSISLSGQAALRSGAGLVSIATPCDCLDTVATFEPCYMTLPLPVNSDGSLVPQAAAEQLAAISCDVIACGPGLGRHPTIAELIVSLYREKEVPMVVDADGLNALADVQHDLSDAAAPRILTPHPGEFKRLWRAHSALPCPQSNDAPALQQWAAQSNVTLVLKGHATRITDKERFAMNPTGNPGMATGGSGDVLTGVIGALIGQGLSAWNAARLGVYVHGLAGDLAADDMGEVSLIARDIIEYLPQAFQHPSVARG